MGIFLKIVAVLAALVIILGAASIWVVNTVDEQLEEVEDQVRAVIDSVPSITPMPTATVIPSPTPQPLSTPYPTVTPQPTATAITIPATLTPRPTATPQPIPTAQPTATPPPTATPQPTATRITVQTATPQPTATPMPNFNDVWEDVRRSIVKVVLPDGKVGTGWFYEPNWIITAESVVDTNPGVSIVYYENGEYVTIAGSVAGADKLRDIAAVYVQFNRPALTGRDVNTSKDTALPVMSLGYSSNPPIEAPNVRVGVITTVSLTIRGSEILSVFESDAQFDPGDSGGPIIDLDGFVVGIAQATKISNATGSRITGRQYALQYEEIAEVWEQLKQSKKLNYHLNYWWESQ